MRLWGMSGSFQTLVETQQDLTYDEVVAMLVEAEWQFRQTAKMQRYIKQAKFRLSLIHI